MSSGYRNKLAGQIGEYLVCAELGRRGMIATPFSGNVPTFDVLATDEACRTVPIQVKATRGSSWPTDAQLWMKIRYEEQRKSQRYLGPVEIAHPELIYVCVAIATPGAGHDRFFILTKADLQQLCVARYTAWMTEIGWKRPRNPQSYDCRYTIAMLEPYEDNWPLILDRLAHATPDETLC